LKIKLLCFILVLSVALTLSACGKADDFYKIIEDMTDEEFLDMFFNNEFIIPDLYMPDDFGVPLLENEFFTYYWGGEGVIVSVESAEQHIREIWESDYAEVTVLDYVGESDYYYSFHAVVEFHGSYIETMRFLIFKSSAVCGIGRPAIRMLERQSFTDIADLMFSAMWFTAPDINIVIYRDVEETERAFIYTYHLAEKPPDKNFVRLTERQMTINKTNGEFIGFEVITELRTVQI
jgi:hypothetical protein